MNREASHQKSTYEDHWKSEKEVKILEIDRQKTVSLLTDAGATEIFNGEITNVKYDTADGELKTKGFSARVRQVMEFGDKGPIITYRWTLKQSEKDLELEQPAKSFEDAFNELSCAVEAEAGITKPLHESRRVTKQRVSYQFPEGHHYEGIQVDIDEIRTVTIGKTHTFADTPNGKVPPFLEVEGDNDEHRAAVHALLVPPGRDPGEVEAQAHMSETDLLKHYGYLKKKKKEPTKR